MTYQGIHRLRAAGCFSPAAQFIISPLCDYRLSLTSEMHMNRKPYRLLGAVLSLAVTVVLARSVLADQMPEIPSGATIKVRMIDKLSSEESQIGDTFSATLEEPIAVNGKEIYPRGADVSGRVVDVHRSGRLSDPGELDLLLTTISSGRMATSVSVEPLVIKGESHTKSNVGKIGGGAALGAIIGGIAGGGKGAAIGAGVGGTAGTGAAAATGKRAAVVESEAVLSFTSTSPAAGTSEIVPSHTAESTVDKAPAMNEDNATNPPAATTESNDATPLFTLRDRRVIRDCVSEHASDFPPGTTERPDMPSGSDRQIRRGHTLPPDVQSSAKSLPLACENQLPGLPKEMDRVVYKGRVLLIDSANRILDIFYLDENQ
jgi:hypothetical protein